MTISEMHNYFKLLLNKAASLNYQNLEPEEIDLFLNQTMFKVIENRAYGNNEKRESVEETQKRVDDLKNITENYSTSVFTTSGANKPNGRFVALPADYRHALQEECLISYSDCNSVTRTKRIEVIPVSHDRYNRGIKDPFHKPYEDQVWRLADASQFELITDGVISITTYYLRYLRTPVSMRYGTTYSTPTTDVNCELSEHIHREIVELAVLAAIDTVQSPRIQTYPQIVKDTE